MVRIHILVCHAYLFRVALNHSVVVRIHILVCHAYLFRVALNHSVVVRIHILVCHAYLFRVALNHSVVVRIHILVCHAYCRSISWRGHHNDLLTMIMEEVDVLPTSFDWKFYANFYTLGGVLPIYGILLWWT